MKNIQMNKLIQITKIIVLGLVTAIGIQYVSAAGSWTPAPANPPAGNVDAPINTSTSVQQKAGPLHLNVGGNGVGLVVFGQSIFNDAVVIKKHLDLNQGTSPVGDGKAFGVDFCLQPGTDPTKCLSYVANGVVTKIIKGSGITINPTTGVGDVTISVENDGSMFNYASNGTQVLTYNGVPGVTYAVWAQADVSGGAGGCTFHGEVNDVKQLHDHTVSANTTVPVSILIGRGSGSIKAALVTTNCTFNGASTDFVFDPVM